VNLKGLFFCCRAVLPTMAPPEIRQDHQYFISTVLKAALGAFIRDFEGRRHRLYPHPRREVGDDNINVNAIAPGSTLSEDNPSERGS